MNGLELRAWVLFVYVVKNLSSNRRAENNKGLVEFLLKSKPDISANMSIKGHFLHRDQDKILNNWCDMYYEHGERSHQNINIIIEGLWDKRMMAENCWIIKRD